MICNHCKEELGQGDEYDLMKSHIFDCNSKVGNRLSISLDEERGQLRC